MSMSKNMPEHVRLYENLRTVSYVPFYLALKQGYFRTQGIEVEMVTSASPAETAIGLLEGRMDVSFGGPMRVTMHHDQDPDCALVCFCQVVGPDPFVLIGRMPNPDFKFADLLDKRLGIVSEVPTPWLTLQDDVRRAGLSPGDLHQAEPGTMSENVSRLHAGQLDVIQVMEPHTSLALANGQGHLWHQFSIRGNVGFTTFYTTRDFVKNNPDSCRALTRALSACIAVIYKTPAIEIASLVSDRFPDISVQTLASAIARYQDARIWTENAAVAPAEFVKLKGALLSGGLIQSDVRFESVIDNQFAH